MNAPTHGAVLDAESVKLLLPGDLLRRIDDGTVWTFDESGPDGWLSLSAKAVTYSHCKWWTFLGRPDADGWMPADGVDLSGMQVELRRDGGLWFRLARPTPADAYLAKFGPVGMNRPKTLPPAQPEPGAQLIGAEKYEAWRASELARKQAEYDRDTPEPGAGELEVAKAIGDMELAEREFYKVISLSGIALARYTQLREAMLRVVSVWSKQPLATQAQAKIARLEGEVAELRADRAPGAWKDREDEWSSEVSAAHPTNATNPDRWATFETAMKMVGNRHGKYALVGLVHWLLTRALSAEADAAKVRKAAEAFMPSAEVAFLWSKETPPTDEVERYRERYWALKKALAAQTERRA